MTCLQVSQRKPKYDTDAGGNFFNHLQLTKEQARMLSVELMLFAEGREIEEFESDWADDEEPAGFEVAN